jgi:hypothetical protein
MNPKLGSFRDLATKPEIRCFSENYISNLINTSLQLLTTDLSRVFNVLAL